MKLQRLLSLTRQALDAYDMIDPGDKIAVGLSGGKDSFGIIVCYETSSRNFIPSLLTYVLLQLI